MPNIRIMNWNLEHLDWEKAGLPGVIDAIARTVFSQSIDLLVIVDLDNATRETVMTALCTRLNALVPAVPASRRNDYKVWCTSHPVGNQVYGFVIRDLNTIRPLAVRTGPAGASDAPVVNLYANTFETFPATFSAARDAYTSLTGTGPWEGPRQPMAISHLAEGDTRRDRFRFAGEDLEGGRYALGAGFRPPCMAMFDLNTVAAGRSTLLPVIVCDFQGTTGSPAGQLEQLRTMHLPQMYQSGGHIAVNGAPVAVQNLIATGTLNVDFLSRRTGGSATQIEMEIDAAYAAVTPTLPEGGSATPNAAAGTPQPTPGTQGGLRFPFVTPYPAAVTTDRIPPLGLRVAATAERTTYRGEFGQDRPAAIGELRAGCLDNFLYGGTLFAGGAVPIPCPAGDPEPPFNPPDGDSALTVDIAANIRQSGDPVLRTSAGTLDLKSIARHFSELNLREAGAHPALFADHGTGSTSEISLEARLVGGKMISSHLPVVFQFSFPDRT